MSQLTFTLIQSDLVWEDKAANLLNFEQKINSIQGKKQVVILPEMFATGFSMQPAIHAEEMNGPCVQWMLAQSAAHKIILCGSLMIKENNQYFNRLLWVQPNGEIVHYDKRHLFSFAGEDKHFTAGEKRVIVSVNGWRILLQVCYDLRFPVFARQQSANEYDAILYVANWPERRIDAWDTLLKARAIENQCYTIGVNRIGHVGNDIYHNGSSSIYSPMGETIYNKQQDEDIFSINLDKSELENMREKLPFLKDRDYFYKIK